MGDADENAHEQGHPDALGERNDADDVEVLHRGAGEWGLRLVDCLEKAVDEVEVDGARSRAEEAIGAGDHGVGHVEETHIEAWVGLMAGDLVLDLAPVDEDTRD